MDSEAMLELMADMNDKDLDDLIDKRTSYTPDELDDLLDDHLKITNEPKRDRIAVEGYIEWARANDVTNFRKEEIEEHMRYLVREGYAKNTVDSGRYFGLVKFATEQLSAVAESQVRDISQSEVVKTEMERLGLIEEGRIGDGVRPITPDEKQKMVQTAPTLRTETMVEILWQCGPRAKELAELEVNRIDFDEMTLEVDTAKRKNHSRTVPFDLELKFKIQKYLDVERPKYGRESPYLFVSRRSDHPMPHNLTRTIRELADKAGVQSYTEMQNGAQKAEITPHSFRKAFGIRMAEQGKSVKEIAETLGHSNTQSVTTYLDIS